MHSESFDILLVILGHGACLVDGVDDSGPLRLKELALEANIVNLGLFVTVSAEVRRDVD